MYLRGNTFISILYVTAVISTCQSITWICLTTCAILTYYCVLPTPQYGSDSFILTTIVKFWFQGDECTVKDEVPGYPDFNPSTQMKPEIVFPWMVAYLAVSIINVIVSILLIIYKARKQLRSILKTWCFVSIVTAIMDVTLTILFILDYTNIKEYMINREDKQHITTIPAGMFILTAKGFALWFFNICLTIYFISRLSKSPRKKERATRRRDESYVHGYDNVTFKNSIDRAADRQVKPRGTNRGAAAERETFPRRLSISSFEAVTAFNQEEHVPVPSRKLETPTRKGGHVKENATCYCGSKRNGSSSNFYHSHSCSTLLSELEAKLQTMRGKTDRPREKVKTLADFSHDIRNFKRGSGRRENQAQYLQKDPPPVATTCANTSFY